MARYHGNKAVVYGSTSGAGVAGRLGSLTKWTLDRSTDKSPATAFGDKNKVYLQGLPDIKGTIGGWWDSDDDALFDGADSPDGVKLYLYPSELYPNAYHYGPAWLDASIDVSAEGTISVSGNFVAAGAWGRRP